MEKIKELQDDLNKDDDSIDLLADYAELKDIYD